MPVDLSAGTWSDPPDRKGGNPLGARRGYRMVRGVNRTVRQRMGRAEGEVRFPLSTGQLDTGTDGPGGSSHR
jgi:hypothetical protein